MVITKVDTNQTEYLMFILLIAILALVVPIYQTVVDIGPDVTHQNHEDTITTPLPGNCGCNYPNCGGCDGQPQITLVPTEIISTVPPFPNPATPDIPDATQFPTVFPTFGINGLLPTPIPTVILPTIAPTLSVPDMPPSPIPVGS